MVLVSGWRCLLAEPERGMDQEEEAVVGIAEVIAAEDPVAVPISAEGTVKTEIF